MASRTTIRPFPSHPHPTGGSPPTIPGPEPFPYFENIGKAGQTALWIGFAVFLASTLLIGVLGARLHVRHRAFHLVTILITGIATLGYYAMATHSGVSYISVGWHAIQGVKAPVLRQMFWARLVDWFFTAPLLLLNLALLGGFPIVDIVSLLVTYAISVVTGAFAGLQGRTAARWGWYVFSYLLVLFVLVQLLWNGRRYAKHQHDHVTRLYTQLAIYTVVVWIISCVTYALGTGSGRINLNVEIILAVIIDILAKSVFGFWLLLAHKHDSEEAHALRFPESWTQPRGTRRGLIHLPGSDH